MRTLHLVPQTEENFMAHVLAFAKATGWLAYHTRDSRRSAPGFPDLVLVRGEALVFAELKTEKGRVSPAQREWLDALASTAAVDDGLAMVCIWRPSDWDEIEEVLR